MLSTYAEASLRSLMLLIGIWFEAFSPWNKDKACVAYFLFPRIFFTSWSATHTDGFGVLENRID